MDSEKVKEIKDKLREEIFIATSFGDKLRRVPTEELRKLLTLINELESENERLSNTEIGELIKENEELAKQCVEWNEFDFKKRNKITELKDRIAELENQMCRNEDLHTATEKLNDIILKQFAEKLKDMPFDIEFTFKESSYEDIKKLANLMKEYSVKYIDETLKEFIEK